MHASVCIAGNATRTEADVQVEHVCTVILGRIVKADGTGHAVAELRSVLDVVYTRDGVVTAEQKRRVLAAQITMPGRRIGRGRLTEGEAGELDEQVFDDDRAAARGVERDVVAQVGIEHGRVEAAAAQGVEREVALAE